ncbi:MAG: class I SAM-dependent methyltransferase [Gammaproteobacteria bacterium]|nr:class I SAM-dependent methyltransferase [Gammaproteobacteria bacterium]MBU1776494.1 class I SAM-dependent methyltransferase [Gammaproteobacteria bacterium]MBU1969751.1 class I SAM-dependent methyltransferase [Gammaproteobacteria bacterium]
MNALLDEVADILGRGGIAVAANEAALIVQSAYATASSDYKETARDMAVRRATGVPLAYVTGHIVFMGVDLIAAEGALVPRVETELLGYVALDVLRSSDLATPLVIDMCCGSGNLACAIAHYHPDARVWASDLTDNCVEIAQRNVAHVGVSDRVVVVQGDLFAGLEGLGLEGAIDIIVCGPPFISQTKLATDSAWLLEHEPREAFDGGPYGLSIQQRIVKEALPFLKPGGMLLFETGLGQERPAKMIFERAKAYEDIRQIADAIGEVRVITARKRHESSL